MSYAKKLTMVFIGLSIVVIGLFDVYVFFRGGTEATISYTIFEWSYKYPMLPFAAGILCGHFFWQMRGTDKINGGTKL